MKKLWFALAGTALAWMSAVQPTPMQARATADANTVVDPSAYQAMRYRSVGPTRGGRVTTVTGVPSEHHTFYMGAAGGGVWKTTDAGETWANISDGFIEAGSIGAVAVADSDPHVIYVGTGSACMRGNVSPGIGVYKSTDGGKTWRHIGLRESGQIARIRIHPRDANLLYVAANGHGFGPNPDRGIFRSRDGGTTWEKALFINDQTGAVDLVMDPKDPNILYAAMSRMERKPWVMFSGGPDGGIFKTTDGGTKWTKLVGGLPKGLLGRIGIAVSPANTNRLWAMVEAENDPGFYMSDDAGQTWRLVNAEHELQQRPFYYHHVYADPKDPNVVYELNTRLYKSTDAGRTFRSLRQPHGDNHDLWINPNDPQVLINGNDGGAAVTYNGGLTWSTQLNQPTAELYRVAVDNQFPYRLYGAQQDNSTISVPSRVTFGITPTQHWYAVSGGESGHIAPHPTNPNIVYSGHYRGELYRYDHTTGTSRAIRPYPEDIWGQAPRDIKYRFQWHAPVRISPHDPGTLYFVSQFVHKTTNEGQSWQVISPDLTRNDKSKQGYGGAPITAEGTGVEIYPTIYAFEESAIERGVLWAGSDDGLVHVSRDAGKTWTNVTPKNLPEWGTVNAI
ncbi:MAG: glycosyl hydrolase, partial [Acidobacteria bacterium]|nr:glycosyl hydrolase [Acidobacteriota bacterium]